MIDEVNTIVSYVASQVTDLEYTSDDHMDEPSKLPAFMIDSQEKEFTKISVNGQLYNTRMELECYLYAAKSMTKANFNTLADNVLNALVTVNGYKYIKILSAIYFRGYLSEEEVRIYYINIEYLNMELK